MVFSRLAMLRRRRSAASRLNIPFERAASFSLPKSVHLGGVKVPLSLPAEAGLGTAFVELLLDDCYQLRRLKGERVSSVIDVGANVGLFGLAARNAFSSATIHAYEPNKAIEHHLAHQASIADFQYFVEAVGREDGRVNLSIVEAESVHTSTQLDPSGGIPQIALRSAVKRIGGTVDLIKLDCEGAEWDMLEDPDSWLGVRFVTLEYHLRPGLDHTSIGSALDRCGFRVVDQHPVDNFGLVFASR